MKAIELLEYFRAEQDANNNTPFKIDDFDKAIEELEDYEEKMDKYLDFTTGGRCSKSFTSCLNLIEAAYEQDIYKIIKENNKMENINTQLIQATQEYLRSDKLKEVISSQAEKMVNEVISDAFKWNGIIKAQLEKEIKENLSLNIEELGVSGHNKFITEVVKDKLHQFLRHDVEVEITKSLEEILKPIDKIVSIERIKQELFEASDKDCVDSCCDDMDYILENYDEDDLFTFNFEHPQGNYKWVDIYLDKEPGKSNYECEFKLCVHETFTTFKQYDREIRAKDKLMNPYKWDIEGFIYQMFLAGSTINYEEAKAL